MPFRENVDKIGTQKCWGTSLSPHKII